MLHGNEASLDDVGAPAFVGRRLCHFTCDITAYMDFEPTIEGEEAGLTVYMNERYHYDLAVKLINGQKMVSFRRTVGSLRTEQYFDCGAGPYVLKVKARPETFTFAIQQGQSDVMEVGSGETHLLSTEVAGGFTGVIVAMYASSRKGTNTPVLFDWFDYEPLD